MSSKFLCVHFGCSKRIFIDVSSPCDSASSYSFGLFLRTCSSIGGPEILDFARGRAVKAVVMVPPSLHLVHSICPHLSHLISSNAAPTPSSIKRLAAAWSAGGCVGPCGFSWRRREGGGEKRAERPPRKGAVPTRRDFFFWPCSNCWFY
jgi:hypothetical protein